jgi:hypothetical protein
MRFKASHPVPWVSSPLSRREVKTWEGAPQAFTPDGSCMERSTSGRRSAGILMPPNSRFAVAAMADPGDKKSEKLQSANGEEPASQKPHPV